MIAIVEIVVGDGAGTAGAFGDVLSGHFQMHAAGIGAFVLMHGEKIADLRDDTLERPGLAPRGGFNRIAVHGIARPYHR